MNEAAPGAPAGASGYQAVDERDLMVLARIAGLPIAEERAAGLAQELVTTLAAARELDDLLVDRQPALAPGSYDPAWPAESSPGVSANR